MKERVIQTKIRNAFGRNP